jgi:predicted transcriptional regulator
MNEKLLKAATEQDFFRRGKALARSADKGDEPPQEHTISFEDPADLLRPLTASGLDVLSLKKMEPEAITVIAGRLNLD